MRSAEELRTHGTALLEQTLAVGHGEVYTVQGVTYRRHDPPVRSKINARVRAWAVVVSAETEARPPVPVGKRADITAVEAEGFWSWAVAATLKETGVRIEELLELTQLSLRHYVAPTTNTIVPLLHIVPSKTDQVRLIPMSPELVKVLLEVQRRARGNSNSVPLSMRYDVSDKNLQRCLAAPVRQARRTYTECVVVPLRPQNADQHRRQRASQRWRVTCDVHTP